jgi:N-acyl-D-aspartate/D-glutamate deacylase
MGGCMTIIQQGRHESYDGIAVLGYSAVHTTVGQADGYVVMVVSGTVRYRDGKPAGALPRALVRGAPAVPC